MFQNQRQIQIEWGDCDPADIVFYPRYFAFFDASTGALFEAMGYSLRDIRGQANQVGFPMIDTRSQFYKPSKYGDIVLIESQITEVGDASFDIKHRLFNDEQLAVVCSEKRVWAGLNEQGELKAQVIPDDIRQRMLA
ncbi:acyl-CoA thioesterase [Marinomonas posidonica]|uniref:Thioesterase superfamily protein n=1 Tax=Marinomonas posidonica (strain CECT 7376 / NCIMB 14433 / IVIA-Po-181) TaxID=491952 RepID=F6CU42_MARPP|nr:thioesterase family protein [Marinomonas posidonica]AEF54094.1 thioesterase superfamily protein [Marinomonas posidonica IVIA-Po-181]